MLNLTSENHSIDFTGSSPRVSVKFTRTSDTVDRKDSPFTVNVAGGRAFSSAPVVMWNGLPGSLCLINLPCHFKSQLETSFLPFVGLFLSMLFKLCFIGLYHVLHTSLPYGQISSKHNACLYYIYSRSRRCYVLMLCFASHLIALCSTYTCAQFPCEHYLDTVYPARTTFVYGNTVHHGPHIFPIHILSVCAHYVHRLHLKAVFSALSPHVSSLPEINS